MLFVHDVAFTSHTEEVVQSLMERFSQACKDFRLTISLKKTNVLGQEHQRQPVLRCRNQQTHRQGCNNPRITGNSRLGELQAEHSNQEAVYHTFIANTLLCESESWMTYARQEQKLNSLRMRFLRWILGISWSDKEPNAQKKVTKTRKQAAASEPVIEFKSTELSEQLRGCLKFLQQGIHIVFKSETSLPSELITAKDAVDPAKQDGVVYRIPMQGQRSYSNKTSPRQDQQGQ
ncbi:hypothetical protein AWC38_SpisGene22142 [Stylophora pistillata]|uniref:Reverse transcriptase domain-containing protein n=1 Tax=Stylophora pistillata TaxID=50429 RepID=A0A2B4R9B8_STYPI|nr:hypothetical protein AWC38_SpisGene22142 [Stylophora pistillata]